MGDVPHADNPLASRLTAAERKFVDLLVFGAEAAAKAYVPFLNLPVVSQVFDFLCARFGDLMYSNLAVGTTFLVLDFQTNEEKKAFSDAMTELAASRQTGDPDEHARALQKAKDAFDRLVHSDGSH